jgi:hypothetical protein
MMLAADKASLSDVPQNDKLTVSAANSSSSDTGGQPSSALEHCATHECDVSPGMRVDSYRVQCTLEELTVMQTQSIGL